MYGFGQEDGIPLWTGPVLQGVTLAAKNDQNKGGGEGGGGEGSTEITLTFTAMSSAGGLSLRDVRAPFSVDDGRGGVAAPTNNCTR